MDRTLTQRVGAIRPAGIFAIGLVSALVWLFVVYPKFMPVEQDSDLNGFGQIGINLARGNGFTQDAQDGPSIRRAPLQPLIIAGVLSITGFDEAQPDRSYTPILVLNAVFAGLWCVAAWWLARRLFDDRAGVAAGIACAVWPQCLRYVGVVDVESTMALLTALTAIFLIRLLDAPGLGRGAVLGLLIGLCVLAKPVALLLPIPVAACMLLKARCTREKFAIGPLVAATGVAAMVCLPWIARNHIVTNGRFRGISTNAPGEFIRGYVNAKPKYFLLQKEFRGNWDAEANRYEERLLKPSGYEFYDQQDGHLRHKRQTIANNLTKDRLESRIAKEMVISDPAGFFKKFIVQLITFWYIVETPAKSVMIGGLALIAIAFAFIGMRARQAPIWVCAVPVAIVLYYQILYAAMLAFARYSMPLFPVILAMSSGGMVAVFDHLRGRNSRLAPVEGVETDA